MRRRRDREGSRPYEEARVQDERIGAVPAVAASELRAPGSHQARVAAVFGAQRAQGNRAVSRVLARDPNPALEKRPARPVKQPLRGGREVDAIFDSTPFLKDLIGAKLGKQKLEKAMKLDDEATFERAWLAYAQRSINPATGRNFTEKEAKDFNDREGVRAFQDEDRGEIHIRKERSDLGTQLHEGLHVFSDNRWRKRMGYNVNEGVTEWFTRKLGPQVQVVRDDSSFLRQYTSVTHLVDLVGEPVVAAAYFEGDIAGLKAAVDAKRGAGTWETWLDHLDANDFKGANALLKAEAAPAKGTAPPAP
ncbi:MAG TPA: hypothetical protein PKD59_00910 [Miltoncostaeaceae bacterium]|nr:hypothetical protein [Miltoncostaeaceae bacterium]